MEEQVKEIMASVFEVASNQITEDTTPQSLENWDSLRHINLVVALEDAFAVEFDEEEIADMISYKLVIHFLKGKKSN
jgi:acyl carrier protein